jgi:hypothetical protein
MKSFFPVIFLTFLGITSLYFGVGGSLSSENYNEISKTHDFKSLDSVKIDKVVYKNAAELLLARENKKSVVIFPWIVYLPIYVCTILTACCYSLLGALICILKKVAILGIPLSETNYISIPVLGFFTGLVILGLNYVIPTVLVSGDTQIRPITLLFLCLFGGIYVSEFYEFLTKTILKKIFNPQEKDKKHEK